MYVLIESHRAKTEYQAIVHFGIVDAIPAIVGSRLIRHFDYKRELFGNDKLTKTITYDDLTEEDVKSLLHGSVQFLGEKDTSGRAVAFLFPGLFEFESVENYVRSRSGAIWTGVVDSLCENLSYP